MIAIRTQLLLASDVDETLLAYNQVMNGELLLVIGKLLALDRVKLAIITGNDYVNLQRQRIVEPLPADLRKNLIVYADGCTRKLTFTDDGQEVLDEAYRSKAGFDRDDKERIQYVLHRKVQEWGQQYPELNVPDVHVEALDEVVQITIGPLGVNSDTSFARRDQLCKQLMEELYEDCTDAQLIPSDVLWVKVRCVALRENTTPDHLKQKLERLMKYFAGLSTPAVIDREEQLAVKPVKPRLRPELTREVRALVSGTERHTNKEYSALIGGRVTIDIQRAGVDKAFAVRNLQRTFAHRGGILYFGDAFGPDGNDRPVAYVEGVQCISVGGGENLPSGVIALDGGPAVTKACLRSILWALTGCSR
jgi:hydroxymethylpyrimidine pyrophosphatase-like HAD family hydrolase